MALWNDFVGGILPYQAYWLPVAIGVAAGLLCLGVGNLVARGRRRKAEGGVNNGTGHDPFTQGSLTEKRQALRRGGNHVTVIYARMNESVAANRAVVLDRSLGGLRLAAEEPVAEKTQLRLLPTSASEQTPWIEVEVIACRPVDDSWELHCQFLKTPQWSVLLLFG